MKRILAAALIFGVSAYGYAADEAKADTAPQQDLQRLISDESAELKTLMQDFTKKANAARARVDEIAGLKKEIADGDKTIAALEQARDILKEDLTQKTAALKVSEESRKTSDAALRTAQAAVAERDASLAKAQEREKALADQIASLTEALAGHEALVKEHALTVKERDAYASRVAGLEKSAKDALAALESSKAETETQTVRAEKAESRLADLVKILADKDAHTAELDTRIASLSAELTQTKTLSAEYQKRAQTAEGQLAVDAKSVERLTKALNDEKAAHEKDRAGADAVITKLRTELTERKKMIVELISKVQ